MNTYRDIQLKSGAVYNTTDDNCKYCTNKALKNGRCFPHQPAPVAKEPPQDKMINSNRADWHEELEKGGQDE